MRTLIVTSEFHPQIGGIQRYVEDMADALSSYVEVGLITGPGQFVPAGQKYPHLGAFNLANPRSSYELQDIVSRLRRLAIGFKSDCIHFANAGLCIYAPHLVGMAPAFATVHGNDLTRPWQRSPGTDVTSAIHFGLLACERVFCVSRFTESQVHVRAPGARTQVVTPGLSLKLSSLLPLIQERKKTRSGNGERTHVVSAGRLVKRKGHEPLLRILEYMKHPVRWTVIGDGACAQELEACIANSRLRGHVKLLGEVDDLEMWGEIANADLFALTPIDLADSRGLDAEGFGLVFIEAAALGIPSIGSVFGGCRQAIQSGGTGLLVDPLKSSDAAQAVDAFLDTHCGRDEIAEDCRRVALDEFRWADRAAIFATAYADAAQQLSPAGK